MRLALLIASVSAAILAYEVALMRALSVAQGHHFAYMVVSTALLGFGASGTLLSLCGRWLRARFEASMTVLATAFAVAIPVSFALAQEVPFDIFQLAWDRMQYVHLLASSLTCFVPFFLGATCIGLALTHVAPVADSCGDKRPACRTAEQAASGTLAATVVRQSVHTLYFWNLLGSGIGSAGIVAVMFLLPPAKLPLAAFAVAAIGCLAYALPLGRGEDCLKAGLRTRQDGVGSPAFRQSSGDGAAAPREAKTRCTRTPRVIAVAGGLAAVLAFFTVISPLQLKVSQYKALAAFLDMGAEVVEERTSPLGTVHVLDGPMVRLVPGLSLAWEEDQPRQRAIVVDAGSASAIYHLSDPKQAAIFDYTTSALPYHLLDKPKTLIIGAGGGGDVWLARYHGCPDITALELDPAIADLMMGSQAEFAGHLYTQPGVRLVVAEARGFLARTREKFDLIQLPLVESFGAAGAGLASLNESYLYTVEAFRSYLDHLTPDGILCVTRWLRNPVSDCDFIRIFSTLTEVLERALGETDQGRHLIAIRGMFTATVLASRSPFSEEQQRRARAFSRTRQFDLVWHDAIWAWDEKGPGYRTAPRSVSKFHQNRDYDYFKAAWGLLYGGRRDFVAAHPLDISPTTDDRPYHSLTQGWRGIRYLREKLGDQWVRYADWGYIVLWATLAQAVILSALFILLPLILFAVRRTRGDGPPPMVIPSGALRSRGISPLLEPRRDASTSLGMTAPRADGDGANMSSHASRVTRHGSLATFVYFASLGVAYMFIEIVFIQKLSLFLASPIYAAAIVLAAFMVFSGLGSLVAGRMRGGEEVAATRGVLGILGVGLLLWFGMDWLLGRFAGQAFGVRALVAAACAGGLAFFMGMPFPSGLRQLAERAPALTPWAWGVNGAASVVGAVLAMVLAVSWGFRLVLLLAFALYALAGAALPRLARPGRRPDHAS